MAEDDRDLAETPYWAVPSWQALDTMSMERRIEQFDRARPHVEATVRFWAQQIMHKQQLSVADRMEKSTRLILGLTVVMALTAIINVCIVVWATREPIVPKPAAESAPAAFHSHSSSPDAAPTE